jgi:hypothetical protein
LLASRINNCRAGSGFYRRNNGEWPAGRFGPQLISRPGWPSREGARAPPPFLLLPSTQIAPTSPSSCVFAIALRESPIPSNAAHANNPTILDEESPRSGRDGRQGHRGFRLRRRKAAAFPHRRRPGRHSAALLAQEPVPLALLRAARRRRGDRPCRRGGGARQLAPCVAALLGGAGDHVLGALRPRTRLVKFSSFFPLL